MKVPAPIRRVTDPLLADVPVPIISGVNRGRWWSLVSAGSGYASGRRASAQMELLASLIRPGDVVWDVGAHHGFVTLCASDRVGAAGAVYAFEPSELNRSVLRRHVRWNHLDNVTVHPFALSDFDGEGRFGGTGTSKMYALGSGPETVPVRRGATLVEQGLCRRPTFVKIDVEGAEAETVAGMLAVLPPSVRLLIAMHDRQADARCERLLGSAGFETVASRALERSRRSEWQSDPDLFCVMPASGTRDADVALFRRSDGFREDRVEMTKP